MCLLPRFLYDFRKISGFLQEPKLFIFIDTSVGFQQDFFFIEVRFSSLLDTVNPKDSQPVHKQ